jgi:hypothetical protein
LCILDVGILDYRRRFRHHNTVTIAMASSSTKPEGLSSSVSLSPVHVYPK